MADNPTVDNGSLTDIVVAGDDVGSSVIAQYVKLMNSTSGSSTLTGLEADPLIVNLPAAASVDVTGDVTITELPTAAALADNTANPTTTIVGAAGLVYDGSTWDRQKGDSTDGTLVNLGANNDVTVTNATATNLKAEVTGATSGSGTATGAIRVELPTNGTGVVGLNAGTNAIGKLAANSGVDIGDVDVTTVGTITPGTGATALGKAEDAVHATGDTGVAVWGVALADANALTLQASATGDYSILSQDARGVLQVVARPQAARISTTSAGLTTATTAYSIGDQTGTILTISNAAKVSGGTGLIQSITLLDEGDVGVSYRLHFYNQSVTLAADNAAFAVSDADQRNYVGTILLPDLADVGANRVATLTNVGLGYHCSGSTSLFCAIETRTANAVYAAVGDLKLILHVYQD